ncbi:MAG: hypothetical protein HY321_18065 [Armatimonadetes bacterium]|nr:hypothetical protein [Armatimonadota bacterium]
MWLVAALGVLRVGAAGWAAPGGAERQRVRLTLLNLVPSQGALDGIRPSGTPVCFGPERLRRYLPEHAEALAGLSCRQGAAASFTDGKAPTRLVILDLTSVLNALAALQRITPAPAKSVDVGRRGFRLGGVWAACRGCYLFRAAGPAAEALVRGVDRSLAGVASQPTLLDVLPRSGLVKGSERAYPDGIPGIESLGGAAGASYQLWSKPVDLYLVEYPTREAGAEAFARLKQESSPYRGTSRWVSIRGGEGFSVEWKGLGRTVAACAGKYVIVAAGNAEVTLLQQSVSSAVDSLVRQVGAEGMK